MTKEISRGIDYLDTNFACSYERVVVVRVRGSAICDIHAFKHLHWVGSFLYMNALHQRGKRYDTGMLLVGWRERDDSFELWSDLFAH